jgi:DNA mismatch repair protein MutH
MDATGRISVQMTEEAGIEQLNISTLPKGLYLIQGMTTFGAQLYARLLLQTDTQ